MSSGKRSSYELSAPADEERPHSFYDNIAAGSSSGTRVIQIPDIQFKFDDDIPITTDPRRSTLMSNAKSDFFGLSKGPLPPAPRLDDVVDSEEGAASKENEEDELQRLVADPDRQSPPVTMIPSTIAGPSSPASTTSTAPARSLGSADNSPGSKSRPTSSHRNITIKLPDAGTPSEAVYMTTTVPQNFSKNASTLIGRHKPTRSSLRHSRMLVVNKNFHQRYPKGNSLNLKHIRLSRLLMVLKILIGAILTIVGLTIIVWSPNTHTKDNPYWAGLILILSGSLFLILFDFKRRPANRFRESCFNFIRINALVMLLLTIFFTMLAFIYALIHTTNLSSESLLCQPEYSFNVNRSGCVCLIDTRPAAAGFSTVASELRNEQQMDDQDQDNTSSSSTSSITVSGIDSRRTPEQLEADGVIQLEYRDFNCNEVLGVWYYVTLGSAILNSLGCLLAAGFLVIYGVECQRREQELKYFSVRTSDSTGNGMKMTERREEGGTEAVQDAGGGENELGHLNHLPRPADGNVTESIDTKTTEA